MAFDGITIACLVKELRNALTGGRIYKIAQPEPDELLLTIKTGGQGISQDASASHRSFQHRLVLSASASLPLVYLTEKNKPGPLTAPGFCMLLRKHLQNGRIISVTQPSLERIIEFTIEHLDELGDLCSKRLIVELMGKHSNIIFCTEDGKIIDSIKHISAAVSSLREVLPGREYFIPETTRKENPLTVTKERFAETVFAKPVPCHQALYTSFTGLSPFMAQEICHRASLSLAGEAKDATAAPDRSATAMEEFQKEAVFTAFASMMEDVRQGSFTPRILYDGKRPVEYSVLPIAMYPGDSQRILPTLSELLEQYYAEKNTQTRIRQKSVDLRKIVQTALERNIKKYDLQMRQIKDTEKKDKYQVYGELITAYGYDVPVGSRSMTVNNYYTGEDVTIPLDPALSPIDNAKKYFEKYSKLKRTYEALSTLTLEVKAQIDHLESIAAALDIARQEADLAQIKEELIETGYIRRKGGSRSGKAKHASRPLHYISSDGFHMYVGKNNYQNEDLTFHFASGSDWWFHAKGIPGSHVIVKAEGKELPDNTFEEAGRLAAYYSRARGQEKAEIDYVERKHVKKPSGANPGFVVYYTNYSLIIDSDISNITLVED